MLRLFFKANIASTFQNSPYNRMQRLMDEYKTEDGLSISQTFSYFGIRITLIDLKIVAVDIAPTKLDRKDAIQIWESKKAFCQ